MRFLTRLLLNPERDTERLEKGGGRQLDAVHASEGRRGVLTDPAGIASLLATCCDERQIARIWAVGARQAVSGRFERVGEKGLVFSVKVPGRDLKLGRISLCTCFFMHRGTARVFFSRVVEPLAEQRSITVRVPDVIAGERRHADERVIVDVATPLRIDVRRDGRTLAGASVVDLSYGGACIAFPVDAVPELSFGQTVAIELGYSHRTVSLDGEVRHAQGSRYGIFFCDSFDPSGELTPPADLAVLVDELARDLESG